jgi:uncharacterized repeat protein (TIGR01451 family)
VNVDRRWLGTSVVRVRVLAAAMVMLAAGCMVLGWGSRSRHLAANAAAGLSSSPALLQSSVQDLSLSTPSAPALSPSVQSQARSLLAGLPLMFEPNQGQANLDPADRRAQFIARGSGYSLMLGSEGAILNLRSADQKAHQKSEHPTTRINSLRMKLANANPNASLSGGDLLPSKSNYILGNDPAKWRHDVPQFARVRYENVYPGINLAFYGNQGKLEYDFQVAPGSDPSQAELEFEGAKKLKLQDGNLVIEAQDGVVRFDAPRVYQQVNGKQRPIEGSFVLRADNRVGFAIGNYDHSRDLVIDPILNYSTYFGGNGDEQSTQLALDNVGNIYIAGSTTSTNLPAAGVFQTTLDGTQNIYIAKIQILNPLSLQFVTYLGGNDKDTPAGLAVDAAGDPFVAGTTSSTNFPTTTTAYQQSAEPGSAGTKHVFVTGLNSTATKPLLYSTYLSGNGDDIASGMTIDARGNAYVTGTTTSNDAATSAVQFPASTLPQGLAYQNISRAPIQFFVTKVNTQASGTGSIAYSTYFGGGNSVTAPVAIGGGITVDANGNVYFTGTTNFTYTGCQGCNTTDFPILNAYQPCLDQAPSSGTGNPPTCTTPANGATDAFVAKLNPNATQGSQLLWSTYFGGTANDSGTAVALDPVGAANVYLVGTTNSTDVTTLTTFAAYQRCLDTPPVNPPSTTPCSTTVTASDAYVARLTNPATSTVATNVSLSYFSYLGGSADDTGLALTVDPSNGAVMTGWTQSGDFPITPNSIQGHLNGPQDAFVARVNTVAVTGQNSVASWAVYFGGTGMDQGTGVALDANENVYVAGDTNSNDLQLAKQLLRTSGGDYNGGFDAFVAQLATASSLSITGQLQSGPTQTYIAAGTQATFVYTVTNEGPDLATNITVTDDLTTTGIPVTFVSASATSGTCSGGSTSTNVSCNIQSLQAGSTATVTIVLTPTPNPNGGAANFNGGKVTAISPNNITPNQASVSAKMSDFGIQVAPNSVSIPVAGAPAPYQVLLTPNPVYPSNISLSCTGAPTGAACVFTPPSVTLNSTSPSAPTLIITTTARPVPLPAVSLFSLRFLGLWLPVPGLALIGIGMGRDRRRRRLGLFLLCLISALILLQPACSGGNNTQPPPTGTPAGTWPITVTATSGSDTKSAGISLVVP